MFSVHGSCVLYACGTRLCRLDYGLGMVIDRLLDMFTKPLSDRFAAERVAVSKLGLGCVGARKVTILVARQVLCIYVSVA